MRKITWYGIGIRIVGEHQWQTGDIVSVEDDLALDLVTQPDRSGFNDEFVEVTVGAVSGIGDLYEAQLVKAKVPTVEVLAQLSGEGLDQIAGRVSMSLDELEKMVRRARIMLSGKSGPKGKSESKRTKAVAEPADESVFEAAEK